MKAIALALCLPFLTLHAQAGQKEAAQRQIDTQLSAMPQPKAAACWFILALLLFGGMLVIWVSCSTTGRHVVILYESSDGRATWVPIATNTVYVAHPGEAIEAFTILRKDGAFYKAAIIK